MIDFDFDLTQFEECWLQTMAKDAVARQEVGKWIVEIGYEGAKSICQVVDPARVLTVEPDDVVPYCVRRERLALLFVSTEYTPERLEVWLSALPAGGVLAMCPVPKKLRGKGTTFQIVGQVGELIAFERVVE